MKNFVRIFLFLNEVAEEVVRTFLESKYLPSDFKTFLQNNRHVLYHLCYNKGLCCDIQCSPHFLPRNQVLRKVQFDLLFDQQYPVCQRRHHCPCAFQSKAGTQLTDIDITLCITLIHNCFVLTQQEEISLTNIRTVRNDIAHFSHNQDLTDTELKTMWKQLKAALIDIGCSNERKEDIRRLKRRPILAVEYTESLRRLVEWLKDTNQGKTEQLIVMQTEAMGEIKNVSRTVQQMDATHGEQFRKIDERLARIEENKVREKRITDEAENKRTGETVPKYLSGDPTENVSPLEESESRYFKLFNAIEQLRKNGENNPKDAVTYSVLVYVVLRGSSSSIELNVLSKVFEALYKRSISLENISIQDILEELVWSEYLEQIDENFITRNINVDKIVVSSFGNVCAESLAEICSFDILLHYVRPNLCETKDFELSIDLYTLIFVLIRRLRNGPDALHVAKYIDMLILNIKDLESVTTFLDTLDQCNEDITAEQLIYLLDGLTSNGTNFEVFKQFERLYPTFHRQVDGFGNTIFHYIVTKFSESERYHLYVEYFCENKMEVMHLQNVDKLTPTDFASYLGRCKVVADVLCHTDDSDEVISSVLNMVKAGVDFIKSLNSSENVQSSLLRINSEEIIFGELEDYNRILEIVKGEKAEISEESSSIDGENGLDDQRTDEDESTSEDKEEKEDLAKAVGEGIINLITDIKKGLNAFTKIPNVIKTIHQATNLENSKTLEDKK